MKDSRMNIIYASYEIGLNRPVNVIVVQHPDNCSNEHRYAFIGTLSDDIYDNSRITDLHPRSVTEYLRAVSEAVGEFDPNFVVPNDALLMEKRLMSMTLKSVVGNSELLGLCNSIISHNINTIKGDDR